LIIPKKKQLFTDIEDTFYVQKAVFSNKDRILDTSINSEDMNEFNKSIESAAGNVMVNLGHSMDLHDIDEHSVEDD